MKKVSLILSIAFLGLSSAAFAGSPKTTDSKATTEATVSPSETKTETNFIYYVIGRNDDDDTYQLSETPAANCGIGTNAPCKITTTVDHSSDLEASQSDVDGGVNVTVNSRHNL